MCDISILLLLCHHTNPALRTPTHSSPPPNIYRYHTGTGLTLGRAFGSDVEKVMGESLAGGQGQRQQYVLVLIMLIELCHCFIALSLYACVSWLLYLTILKQYR